MHEKNIALLCDEADRLLQLNINLLRQMVEEPDVLSDSKNENRLLFDKQKALKRIEELEGEQIKTARREMVLAVVGTMKAGKSTTINAIVGQDDPDVLKKLYDKILDIDLKEYSGLDDKTLGLLDKASSQAMSEANLEFQVLSIVYLPDELKEAQRVIDKAREAVKTGSDIWLATDKEYEAWLDAQETASSAYNVKNVSAAMQIIFRIFEQNLSQLAEGWEGADPKNDNSMWVPLSTVVGRSKIPVGSAKIIKKALDRMVGHGDITNKNLWEGLEYLCADYLGGE